MAQAKINITDRWLILYSLRMGAFPVSLEKENQLAQRMASLAVREADIEESFVRSGGITL